MQSRGVVGLTTSKEGCYKAFTALWRRRPTAPFSIRYLPLILLLVMVFQEIKA